MCCGLRWAYYCIMLKGHMNRIELGDLLKQKRTASGRTLRDLSKSLGVSINYLSAIEKGGIRCPSKERLESIVIHYRVEPEDVWKVFYPSDDVLDELEKVNREFNEALNLSIFEGVHKERMLKENLGIETKKFIINLAHRLKNPTVILAPSAPSNER